MVVAIPHRPEPPAPSRMDRIRARAGAVTVTPGPRVRAGLAAVLVATVLLPVSSDVRPAAAGVAPGCTTADVLTRYRNQADWYRSQLDTKYRLSSTSKPSDLVSVGRSGASGYGSDSQGRARGSHRHVPRRKGVRGAVRRAVRLPQLLDPGGDVQHVGPQGRLHEGEARVRATRPLRAPAGYCARSQDARRPGALVLRGLGHHEGRRVAAPERLEVRLGHELPQGQVAERHLLQVRALAFPVRRSRDRVEDPRVDARPTRVALPPRCDEDLDRRPAEPDADPEPDAQPSPSPTEEPSATPSEVPSTSPSEVPSASPSDAPTVSPSEVPSDVPSASPSQEPTPSAEPSAPPADPATEPPAASAPSGDPAPAATGVVAPWASAEPATGALRGTGSRTARGASRSPSPRRTGRSATGRRACTRCTPPG